MLNIQEIETILKNHGIKFKRDQDTFIIDSFEDSSCFEKVNYKSLNNIAKIKNWLGY